MTTRDSVTTALPQLDPEAVMNDALVAGLTAPIAALGVDVEAVEVQKAGRRHVVRVVVDRDGGVDLDLVAEVSRTVSNLLDIEPLASVLTGPFVLEVSSPGIERPLTLERHWRRAATRLVEVHLRDGATLTGRVVEVSDRGLVLQVNDVTHTIALTDLAHGLVQVEFAKFSDEGQD
jgi:ribosome maturation factor RimP